MSLGLKQLLESMRTEKSSESETQMQFSYQNVFNEFKNSTTFMVSRDMFDDALKNLQDEAFLTIIGTKFIRLTTV